MSTILKTQMNVKVSNDIWISISFEHILSTEDEARDAGVNDRKMADAWLEGYGD